MDGRAHKELAMRGTFWCRAVPHCPAPVCAGGHLQRQIASECHAQGVTERPETTDTGAGISLWVPRFGCD